MKYQAPRITRYSHDQLVEFMGPAETNYCELNSATASPETFLLGKSDITLTLNLAVVTCAEASQINLSLINSQGVRLTMDTLDAATDARVSGLNLVIDSYDFGLVPDPGDYTVEVVLIDSSGCASTPVFASFTVM